MQYPKTFFDRKVASQSVAEKDCSARLPCHKGTEAEGGSIWMRA